MQLFEEKDGKVILSTELKLVPEFKRVITADKDIAKRGALKTFTYIYFMYDYRSPYNQALALEDRRIKVCTDLQLASGWKEDLLTKEAISKYMEFLNTASLQMLIALREGLFTAREAVEMLTFQLQGQISLAKNAGSASEIDPMDKVMSLIDNLFKVSDKLPKMLDTLTSLEERVKTEQSNTSKIRGGGTKGLFED
jgi:hypothetical protein